MERFLSISRKSAYWRNVSRHGPESYINLNLNIMKTLLLWILCLSSINNIYSQFVSITDLSSTAVENGINVNVKTFSGTVSDRLSSSYVINDNIIDLSLCYWTSDALLATFLDYDFYIPLSNPGNYTINVSIHMSTSNVICDDFIISDIGSTNVNFLSINDFKLNSNNLFLPNPTNGILESKENLKINKVAIFDNCGRLVNEFKSIENKRLDLNALIDGVYFLKMETENGNSIQKIMLKK